MAYVENVIDYGLEDKNNDQNVNTFLVAARKSSHLIGIKTSSKKTKQDC